MPTAQEFEDLNVIVSQLKVTDVSIGFSAKRTIKIGDEYKTFEAHETWTLKREISGDTSSMEPKIAQHASNYWTPHIIRKVFYALFVAGVLSLEEYKVQNAEISRFYGPLVGRKPAKNDDRQDSTDLSGARESSGSSPTGPPTGTEILDGADVSMPGSAGSSEFSVGGSQQGNVKPEAGVSSPEGDRGVVTESRSNDSPAGTSYP